MISSGPWTQSEQKEVFTLLSFSTLIYHPSLLPVTYFSLFSLFDNLLPCKISKVAGCAIIRRNQYFHLLPQALALATPHGCCISRIWRGLAQWPLDSFISFLITLEHVRHVRPQRVMRRISKTTESVKTYETRNWPKSSLSCYSAQFSTFHSAEGPINFEWWS